MTERRVRTRSGFMNIFFTGAVFIVMYSFLIITKEACDMRLRRHELENMLQFDYKLETYYLLFHSGFLSIENEVGYGSFDEFLIEDHFKQDQYIEIRDRGDHIELKGVLSGEERGYYEIKK